MLYSLTKGSIGTHRENKKIYEGCRLLGCGAVWVLLQPAFLRNVGANDPHDATSKRTALLIVTDVDISNTTNNNFFPCPAVCHWLNFAALGPEVIFKIITL
jgi:hypothetical protein